jgi:predicted enzyme related to lactoylglutathione lyase
MDWTLELVVVPVADMGRAKAFYVDQAGFDILVDHTAGDFRVIQLTPPGSACSIALLKDSPMAPGSLHGVHLCVNDIEAARAQLVGPGRRRQRTVLHRWHGTTCRGRPKASELRHVHVVPRS